jgi:hypothetical protein
MFKAGIDQDALIKLFSEATAKQGEALRTTVRDATLQALRQRELTMANIKKVLQTVTAAATAGAATNTAAPADIEAMLTQALAGMDGALLKAVEANRRALEQFVAQGAAQEKQFKSALANIERMEDTFFASVTKAVQDAGLGPLQRTWESALGAMKQKGSDTGAQATLAVEQLMTQAQEAMRQGRAATAKAAQAMLDGYAALVSGVLIGMSEGMQKSGGSKSGG